MSHCFMRVLRLEKALLRPGRAVVSNGRGWGGAGDGVGGYINMGNPETRKTKVGAGGGRTMAKQS